MSKQDQIISYLQWILVHVLGEVISEWFVDK